MRKSQLIFGGQLKYSFVKYFLGLLLIFTLASCSLKEASDNGFKTTTKTKAFAPSKTLAERFGDGKQIKFTVKIPLTEDSVGYYDLEDVLGNRELDAEHKTFVEKVYDGMKLSMYNLFVKMGYSNKMKFSSSFNFPKIDKRFIKAATVKKVFFTTEDCRIGEDDCNDTGSMGSNFNLVEKFFVNLSSAPEDSNTHTSMVQMEKEEFKKKSKQAFSQTLLSIKEAMESDKNNKKSFDDINLVSFSNDVPYLSLDHSQVSKEKNYINIDVKSDRDFVAKYLRSDRFKSIIKRVEYGTKRTSINTKARRRIRGINIYLKDGAKASDIFEIVSKEQSPLVKKMFILRLNGKYVEAKNYFNSEKLKGIVKDTTMIGRSLFVEIKDEVEMDKLKSHLENTENQIHKDLEIYKIDTCMRSNCLDLEVKEINLVPLIEKNPKINIETYLSVRNLGNTDFKYNGFIEVEIILELPI
jgi:hypothetical protein